MSAWLTAPRRIALLRRALISAALAAGALLPLGPALAAGGSGAGTSEGGPRPTGPRAPEAPVRVVVGLDVRFRPEGSLSPGQVRAQRSAIARARTGLQAELRGKGYQTLHAYASIPYVALELAPRALQAVRDSDRVSSVSRDRLGDPQLANSTPLVGANPTWETGYTGRGKVVAVLDTGMDSGHWFLAGKVVEEACYSLENSCPNGLPSQVGTGSGAPCYYATACSHGTHVGGIVAGDGGPLSGVAPDAKLMSVQVFSRFRGAGCEGAAEDPCARSYESDQIAGLLRVLELSASHDFSSVNLSIGGGRHHGDCDQELGAYKAAVDNLRSAGIPTIIGSGNSGYGDSLAAPACISSAISVGATTKADAVAPFSNSASGLTLLAPGSSINSSVPGGSLAIKSGTSMAAPHVAGAWALLREQSPGASVDTVLAALQATGRPITDARNGLVRRRIQIDAAARRLGPLNDQLARGTLVGAAGGTAAGSNAGATKQTQEPGHAGEPGGKSVWYRWAPAKNGTATVGTGGSAFDTLLGVYTGRRVRRLKQVASDDDGGPGTTSRVRFRARAGRTYRIAVDGGRRSGVAEAGDISLNVALTR